MNQLNDYSDSRLLNGCIYCGGKIETREHVPSKIFLDKPFPSNLPIVGACRKCNNGFSIDEEYVACLIEAARSGNTDNKELIRPRIYELLKKSSNLKKRIDNARYKENDTIHFIIEKERVINILTKLAKGHAAYELSQSLHKDPDEIIFLPINEMPPDMRLNFEDDVLSFTINEIGTRCLQRNCLYLLNVVNDSGEEFKLPIYINSWIEVQEGRYRYLADDSSGDIIVKIVIAEYLACKITWEET